MRVLAVASAAVAVLGLGMGWSCAGRGESASGCAGAMERTMRGGMMRMSMIRHHYVMRHGLPARYRGKSNPLRPVPEVLERGRALYQQHCAVCHGPSGRGAGPAARGLDPPPADLARSTRMPMASDAYLYWTLAEGGVPVGSEMPAFGGALGEDDIWSLVLYLRQL